LPDPGFGIYLHWPFCGAKCPYCDFNSHVAASIDQRAWTDAYCAELDRYAQETSERKVTSVFFGGGTPSLMDPRTVSAILERIGKNWSLGGGLEITLEANPTSVEAKNFAGYAASGVNRLSIGIQALSDVDLKTLGRLHDVEEALSALDIARRQFERVNFDLIYARQDQRLDDWEAELSRALALGPDHLSLYQLTIEEGTAFGARHAAGKLRGLPGDALAVDMYFLTQQLCETAGLPAYEVSNHARPGEESRHNLTYWRSGDWVGIGPGAHGRLTLGGKRVGTETVLDPAAWLANPGESLREAIPMEEQAEEFLLMGLRLREGIDLEAYQERFDVRLKRERLVEMAELSLIEIDGPTLRLSREGWPVLNSILLELLRD
jgi:oxygen-independent coproporphyrinogen-3 oxidase